MWEDPIVAEVHRIRQQLAAEHGYDVKSIFAELRRREQLLKDRLVVPESETHGDSVNSNSVNPIEVSPLALH